MALASKDEFKLKAVVDILESKLVKRKVPLKNLSFGTVTPAAGSTVRQEVTLQQGIPTEKAREIVKAIKDAKLKVQASIQGDFVRVSGRDRDTLQQAIQLLRGGRFRTRHAVHELPDELAARVCGAGCHPARRLPTASRSDWQSDRSLPSCPTREHDAPH